MAKYDSEVRTNICDFPIGKRGNEFIRLDRIEEASGDVKYDVRKWYYDDSDDERPTQKGVRLSREMASAIFSAISADMEKLDSAAKEPGASMNLEEAE